MEKVLFLIIFQVLNYPDETVRILNNLSKYANGMILITGQVGSGKISLKCMHYFSN